MPDPAAGLRNPRALLVLAALLVCSLAKATPAARCQTAYLVRDLAPGTDTSSSTLRPVQFFSLGNRAVFLGGDSQQGPDYQSLWVTDGTPGGTQPLAGVCPRGCPEERLGTAIYLGSARGVLFFVDDLGQLFRTDGTAAGTVQLTSELSGAATLPNRDFVFLNGILYFVGCANADQELWRSDGTVGGTTKLAEMSAAFGCASSEPRSLVVAGGRLFFLDAAAVWTSDGTAAGTLPVPALASLAAVALSAVGNRLFILGGPAAAAGGPSQLWATGAGGAGPQLLLALPLDDERRAFQLSSFVVAGGRLLFAADDGSGNQLWSSDGTAAGTAPLTQFSPGTAEFDGYQSFVAAQLGGNLVFTARIGNSRSQLWSLSGSPATVTPLTSAEIVDLNSIVVSGSRLVFDTVETPSAQAAIWSTDGTVGGTQRLKVTCDAQCSRSLYNFARFLAAPGGKTFFGVVAADAFEIWTTDGTPAGTQRFGNGLMTLGTVDGTGVALVAGKLLYTGWGGAGEGQLWISDGTAAGTRQLTDQVYHLSSSPRGFAALSDQVFFVATAPGSGAAALWRSAGTADTTVQLASPVDGLPVVAGASAFFLQQDAAGTDQLWSADPSGSATRQLTNLPAGQRIEANLVAYRGELVFAVAGATSCALWRSDGTAAGTVQAVDLSGRTQHVTRLTALEPDLYFATYATNGGVPVDGAPWRSDGTPAGTEILADLPSIPDDPRFTRAGSSVFFLADDPYGASTALWRTDGTKAGTVTLTEVPDVPDLVALDGSVYFFKLDALWRSDGTAAGTLEVLEFERSGGTPQSPSGLTAGNGRLFFSSGDADHGVELWTSDGTAAATTLLRDLYPGPEGSMPSAFTVAGQRLYFTAFEPLHGTELWESDGTAAGTRLVQDVQPGPTGSFPAGMTPAGGLLYFAADDGLSGTELWALPLAGATGCSGSGSALCLQGNRFKVEAAWRDFQGNSGTGQAVPLSADTGYFWFFSPGNVEVIVKVLDGRGVDGAFWVFYGALSNVEYAITVTDTQTGLTRRYVNPAGQFASAGDVSAFPSASAPRAAEPWSVWAARPRGAAPPPLAALASGPHPAQGRAAAGPCQPGPARLCLNGDRFAVEVSWKDFNGNTGIGTAVPLTGDTGSFWFFDAANVEVVLKVLDGRGLNGHFWVFYGALSDVEYTLTVTDTLTGEVRTYDNPSGRFASVGDTGAF
jgi:ELWxxDGT repeat protein